MKAALPGLDRPYGGLQRCAHALRFTLCLLLLVFCASARSAPVHVLEVRDAISPPAPTT